MKKLKLIWKRHRWKILLLIVVIFLTAEMGLRLYGLGTLPLYTSDPNCEYRFLPNQKIYRYGNLFETDDCGCRNRPVDTSKTIIAKFGDSVLSGGSHVDQDSTATERLNTWLEKTDIQSTNCSAGSWGVENAYQFMQYHINYEMDAIVLVFSSHDWHDNMHFKPVVGNHPAWPDAQPWLAITDVWSGYVWPNVKSWFGYSPYEYLRGFDDSKVNPGWQQFLTYSKEKEIPLFVYVHPEIDELQSGQWSKYGQELITWLKENNIPFSTGMVEENKKAYYLDNIHMNNTGHAFLFLQLKQLLSLHLPELMNANTE